MIRVLAAATGGAAILAIAASVGVLPRGVALVFKPLTTILILVHAWPRGQSMPLARRFVLIGLLCSLVGDIALLWPKEGFLHGLLSFLLAHLAYLVAFTREQRLAARPLAFVVYGLVAGSVLAALWPGVPEGLRLPVVAYVICLASMAAQAAVLWLANPGSMRHRGLAIGGALFVLSDALLAINRFVFAFPTSGLWILLSYWIAQWLIASWLEPAPTSP
jgi:uncharacterized membrane protein YhhN